jgi:hypothetical protein
VVAVDAGVPAGRRPRPASGGGTRPNPGARTGGAIGSRTIGTSTVATVDSAGSGPGGGTIDARAACARAAGATTGSVGSPATGMAPVRAGDAVHPRSVVARFRRPFIALPASSRVSTGSVSPG